MRRQGTNAGGNWNFTVSGQTAPFIPVTSREGEIWRLSNGSGYVTYDLQLLNSAGKAQLVQLLSVDGVTVNLPPVTTAATMPQIGAASLKLSTCPGTTATTTTLPVCASEIIPPPGA